MAIKQYLDILIRRMFTIAIVVATALILLSVYGFFIEPNYVATAVIRVLQDPGLSDITAPDELQGDRLMRTYVRMLISNPTLQEAQQ